MPHITLEYSSNILDGLDIEKLALLFHDIHDSISKIANIDIFKCKSRMIPQEYVFIGKGDGKSSFVHLEVQLFEGRPKELKSKLGYILVDLLQSYFIDSQKIKNVQISVHLVEIIKENYFNITDSE